jgi:hypothetical protein
LEQVAAELQRVGASALYPEKQDVGGTWVRIEPSGGSGQPAFSWTGKALTALARLRELPDNGGIAAVVAAFPRERTPVVANVHDFDVEQSADESVLLLEALNEIGEEGQGDAPHEDCQRAAAMLELTMSPEFAGWRRVELMFEAVPESGQLPRFDVALRQLLRDDFGGISWLQPGAGTAGRAPQLARVELIRASAEGYWSSLAASRSRSRWTRCITASSMTPSFRSAISAACSAVRSSRITRW